MKLGVHLDPPGRAAVARREKGAVERGWEGTGRREMDEWGSAAALGASYSWKSPGLGEAAAIE